MSDNTTIPQTFTNSELPVDTVYFMSADKNGKLQFPGTIDASSINISLDNIDSSGLKFSNLNVNAFQEKGWNSENFPTNATYTPWSNTTNAKGWFLLYRTAHDTAGVSTIKQRYKLYFSEKQQNTAKIESDTVPSLAERADVSGFVKDTLLTISLTTTYANCFKVDEINTDERYIVVSIVNCDSNPFAVTQTLSYSPFFKGAVIITGTYDSSKLPYEQITSKYLTNGVVTLGYNSINAGDSITSTGYNSFSFGPDNVLYDAYSSALGNANKVFGYSSVALGQQNLIYGEKTIVGGGFNKVSATYATVFGNGNTVIGHKNYDSFQSGSTDKILSGIFVAGYANSLNISNNATKHPTNIMLGYCLQSKYPEQITIGRYNKNNGSNLLEIGMGSPSGRKNALEIRKSSGELHVAKSITINGFASDIASLNDIPNSLFVSGYCKLEVNAEKNSATGVVVIGGQSNDSNVNKIICDIASGGNSSSALIIGRQNILYNSANSLTSGLGLINGSSGKQSTGKTVLGRYNDFKDDAIFSIGVGTGNGSIPRKNGFEITNSGVIRVPVFGGKTSNAHTGDYAYLRVYKDGNSEYKLSITVSEN